MNFSMSTFCLEPQDRELQASLVSDLDCQLYALIALCLSRGEHPEVTNWSESLEAPGVAKLTAWPGNRCHQLRGEAFQGSSVGRIWADHIKVGVVNAQFL